VYAARGASLFVLVIPSGQARSVTVMRFGADGAIARNRVAFGLADYLMNLSTGPGGIYAGTAVIKRFTSARDELVRIDPSTLRVVARASFPGSVATIERGGHMWASIGDGRVARLNPMTLATLVSRRVLPASRVTARGATVSKPAFGLGSLWVLAGDERDLQLVRMNPTTLAVLSRARVPTGGVLYQALNKVEADSSHVYLTGSAIARVDRDGSLIGRPISVPQLEVAEIHGVGLVGLTTRAVVLLTPTGRVIASTGLRDAGSQLTVSGDDAWFVGDAGRGEGIVHMRLVAPRPA
jgi:hypothetical protein